MRADLVVRGRVATLAGDDGPGWVDALAIAHGRVIAAGRMDDVASLVGPRTEILDLGPDRAAIPGLTDSHLHLSIAALAASRVQLEGATSPDELVARVAAGARATSGDDAWVLGSGWSPDALGRWPTARDLDAAAPGRRVALWAHDHHSLLVSARVLRDAGIDAIAGDPPGGVILRDGHGRATGVLQESAAGLAGRLVPPDDAAAIATAVRAYGRSLLGHGIVAVHDPGPLHVTAGLGPAIEAYRDLAARGELPVRVHACVREAQLDAAAAAGLRSGGPLGPDPRSRLRTGWLKLFADGSLGSRTAALLEPMEPGPGGSRPAGDPHGVWTTPPAELAALVARAAGQGIASMIHAIGDAAVRGALDALALTAGRVPVPPRVEHVQLLHELDTGRFAALGVTASVQPVHVRTDAPVARAVWGARADTRAYPYGALARAGARICFGSDAPVEDADPWPGIAIAVTRRSGAWAPDVPALGPAQAMPLWRAIRAAALDPALAASEADRGRLVPGFRADLVVLDAAALREPVVPGGPLETCRPRLVLVDGEVVAGTDA